MFPGGSGSVNNVNLDILITKNRRDMTIDGQGRGRGVSPFTIFQIPESLTPFLMMINEGGGGPTGVV